MPQSSTVIRRIVLNARPRGAPTAEDFRLENTAVSTSDVGQVLLRTLHHSLDLYLRGPVRQRAVRLQVDDFRSAHRSTPPRALRFVLTG